MRRIPYIRLKQNNVEYLCPKCKNVIPRDFYRIQDWCPSCDHPINRFAKNIMKVYELMDEEFYKYFIDIIRGDIK